MSTLESANVLRQICRSRVAGRHRRRLRRDRDSHQPASRRLRPEPDGPRPAQPSRAYRRKDCRHHRAVRDSAVEVGRLAQIPGVVVEGLYGAERWHDGNLATQQTPGRTSWRCASTCRHWWPAHRRPPGLDRGQETVARRPCPPDRRPRRRPGAPCASRLAPRSASHGMEVRPGAEVLEICIPGIDKASAVRRLVNDAHRGPALHRGRRR